MTKVSVELPVNVAEYALVPLVMYCVVVGCAVVLGLEA